MEIAKHSKQDYTALIMTYCTRGNLDNVNTCSLRPLLRNNRKSLCINSWQMCFSKKLVKSESRIKLKEKSLEWPNMEKHN